MWLKLIFLLSLTSTAWAYKFTDDFVGKNIYWEETPVSIMVVDSNPERKSKIESFAQTAISEWQSRSNQSIWNFVSSGSKNVIRWSSNFAKETGMDAASVLAVAIRYQDGPYFAKTEIVINGNHSYNSNDQYLLTTITHELGHTMGLDHSDVGNAVMAPTLQPWYNGLHSDDVAGMKAAMQITSQRQLERYISPYATETEETQSSPLSCGTVGPISAANTGASVNGLASLAGGILISFVRKILQWFKSRF